MSGVSGVSQPRRPAARTCVPSGNLTRTRGVLPGNVALKNSTSQQNIRLKHNTQRAQECEHEDPLKNDDDEAQGVTPSTTRARDTDAFANFNFTDPNFFSAGSNAPGVRLERVGRAGRGGGEKQPAPDASFL